MSRYVFIAACAESWPVQALCRVLGVSSAGYYQWRQRRTAAPAPWQAAAQDAFTCHAQRYGTRRLRAELRAESHAVGRHALRTGLHRKGLRALSTRPPRPRTTVVDSAAVVAENRLLGRPAPIGSGWVVPGRAISCTCPWWAGASATWLPGTTPAHAGSWAVTWPRRCPPNSCCWPRNKP